MEAKKESGTVLKAIEIAASSGSSHAARVAKKFTTLGWEAILSPYYSDSYTDKPREIDIFTRKLDPVGATFRMPGPQYISTAFLVECKHVPPSEPIIIYLAAKEAGKAEALAKKMVDSEDMLDLASHRYMVKDQSRVGKFFAQQSRDVFGLAIGQVLHALIYYRNRDIGFTAPGSSQDIVPKGPYPLVVLNSFESLFGIDIDGDLDDVQQITKPFQLEVNYAYYDLEGNPRNEYFLIDVVSLDTLEAFLANLDKNETQKQLYSLEVQMMRAVTGFKDTDITNPAR